MCDALEDVTKAIKHSAGLKANLKAQQIRFACIKALPYSAEKTQFFMGMLKSPSLRVVDEQESKRSESANSAHSEPAPNLDVDASADLMSIASIISLQ